MDVGFYVYGIGTDFPRYIHPTIDEAEREAERLAGMNPGRCFQVLAIIGQCKKQDFIWDRVDTLPF